MLKNNKGMTLVEIIVATILLSIVVTGFSMIFSYTILWVAKSNKNTTAQAAGRKYTDNGLSGIPLTELEELEALNGETGINIVSDGSAKNIPITWNENGPNEYTESISAKHTSVTVEEGYAGGEPDKSHKIQYDIFSHNRLNNISF